MFPFRPAGVVLLALFGLTACVPKPPPPQGVIARVLNADAVYLIHWDRSAGTPRAIITEVWLQRSSLGPMPTLGSEWRLGRAQAAHAAAGGDGLVCLNRTDDGDAAPGFWTVRDGQILPDGVPTATLHAALRDKLSAHVRDMFATPPRSMPAPTLARCIADADAIYLALIDTTGGFEHFRVAEVWRHHRAGAAPAIGAELRDLAGSRATRGVHDGDMAVAFFLPRPASGDPSHWVPQVVLFVRNGQVGGTEPVDKVHQRVLTRDRWAQRLPPWLFRIVFSLSSG